MMNNILKKLKLKRHMMTAISFFLPFVVAGGFLLALGNIFDGNSFESISDDFTFADILTTMGALTLSMLPVFVSTFIAFSIADKPGIAVGFIAGMVANNPINAGFLGGLIGGYLAGYMTLLCLKYIKVPSWAEGLKPTLIIPFVASLLVGLLLFYVIGTPINWMMTGLLNFLEKLDPNALILFGAVIGILSAIDYGGPINKTTFAFVFTLFAEGVYEPIAVLIIASMITPFGFAIAYFLQKIFRKNIYNKTEVETLKTAFPMGICQITEGVFPIVFNDIGRSVLSTGIGGAVTGALAMSWGVYSTIPAGGMLALSTTSKPFEFFLVTLIGSVVTGAVFFIIRKPCDPNSIMAERTMDDEEDIDFSDLQIS